jgi:hypothetical protein
MPIEFSCPHCESIIRVADGAGGKKGTCPQCREKIVVPATSENSGSRAAVSPGPVEFRSADPPPEIAPAPPSSPTVFPTFDEPRQTSATVRDLRDRRRSAKPRSSGGLAVPIMCGTILFGAVFWYIQQTQTGLGGTLEAVVVEQPRLPEGIITRAELTVEPQAFDGVRKSLEERSLMLSDQHQLAEVELTAGRVGLLVRVHPTRAARVISLSLNDPKLREFVAQHAREFNRVRLRQISDHAEDFIQSWSAATEEERAKLPRLNEYFEHMAIASATSGFGYHAMLVSDGHSYPCVGVGPGGELLFCVPRELEQFTLKGRRPSGDSPRFPGEYSVRVRSNAAPVDTAPRTGNDESAPIDGSPGTNFERTAPTENSDEATLPNDDETGVP